MTQFHWTESADVHSVRRKEVAEKFPEISRLSGYDHRQAIFCGVTVLIQIGMAWIVSEASWFHTMVLSYVISGTLNHSIMLALHELCHDNFFQSGTSNRAFSILANLPLGIPTAATFRRYHLLHHSNLGVHMVDMDLPTEWEASFFNNAFGRLIWLLLQPLFYALRPVLLKPLRITYWEVINWVAQLMFNLIILTTLGGKAMAYLLLGTVLGTGLHPMSGHFLEHLEVVDGQETYSYYGFWNLLTYNVGYHNEHHDFPSVPGSRLPELKDIAMDTYSKLPSHSSWCLLLWDFVVGGRSNLFCRFKRSSL